MLIFMPNRIIKSTAKSSSLQVANCLNSLLALELMVPSRTLYLISPWISDVPLISNRFGQFRAILPEDAEGQVRLATILNLLADRGSRVRILAKAYQRPTGDFLSNLSSAVQWRTTENLHEKGIIGDHFYLRGSMNFTYSGVNLNDEHIELTTDIEMIALALAEAAQRWEDAQP